MSGNSILSLNSDPLGLGNNNTDDINSKTPRSDFRDETSSQTPSYQKHPIHISSFKSMRSNFHDYGMEEKPWNTPKLDQISEFQWYSESSTLSQDYRFDAGITGAFEMSRNKENWEGERMTSHFQDNRLPIYSGISYISENSLTDRTPSHNELKAMYGRLLKVKNKLERKSVGVSANTSQLNFSNNGNGLESVLWENEGQKSSRSQKERIIAMRNRRESRKQSQDFMMDTQTNKSFR